MSIFVSVSVLRNNIGKYLLLSATEDVYITRDGKVISMLTSPFRERTELAKSLFGVLPNSMVPEEAREEQLFRT